MHAHREVVGVILCLQAVACGVFTKFLFCVVVSRNFYFDMKDLITKFIPGGSSSSNNNAGNRTPEVRIEVTEPENSGNEEEEETRIQWKSPVHRK